MMKKDIHTVFLQLMNFLATQARELVCVNVSDISGTQSQVPHTILAATFLTGSSLRRISRDCLLATQQFLELSNVKVLNYACDGESLHLVTVLADGTPGNEVSLLKDINSKLNKFSKKELVQLVSENSNINLALEPLASIEEDSEDLIDTNNQYSIENIINDSIDSIEKVQREQFSLDDIEVILKGCASNSRNDFESRRKMCASMKISELRALCLNEVFPYLKEKWLKKAYGEKSLTIHVDCKKIRYCPSTIFEVSQDGLYRTVTFDPAHIANLLREHAAKGKLSELGLSDMSLKVLSEKDGYSYIKSIISLKGSCLEFDPMNQVSSATLFSCKTEKGLEMIDDFEGAKCCKTLREGLIESMDMSGVSSIERCIKVINLKRFLESKIKPIKKVSKSSQHEISSELYQMLHCTLDSHIVSYLNIEFFNPRRKSTGTVEQFFSHITLMNDGGRKLTCKVLSDVIRRVIITNSLRLLPVSVKGFSFLGMLKLHMTSYKADEEDSEWLNIAPSYPVIFKRKGDILPQDSSFDAKRDKKRKLNFREVVREANAVNVCSNVRKFVKKF